MNRESILPASSEKRRNAGFTLVELLVVIAIIGVLAGILIIVVSTTLRRVKTAKCAFNLHQVGQAISLYAADNKGKIVPWRAAGGQSTYWQYLLAPYLGSAPGKPLAGSPDDTVLMCPVDMGDGNEQVRGPYKSRFCINPHVAENNPQLSNAGAFRVVRMHELDFPSRTYVMSDGYHDVAGQWVAEGDSFVYPHDGRMNVLFLDSHVESMTHRQMNYLGQHSYHVFWRGYDWGKGGYETAMPPP